MPAERPPSSEKQIFEPTGVPLGRLTLASAGAFLVVLVFLAAVFGLYRWWVNGPQAPVLPAPLANPTAPRLEIEQFRARPLVHTADPKLAAAEDYRWRDAAHSRVTIPVDRAMAMTAARGARAFDPPEAVGLAPAAPR